MYRVEHEWFGITSGSVVSSDTIKKATYNSSVYGSYEIRVFADIVLIYDNRSIDYNEPVLVAKAVK